MQYNLERKRNLISRLDLKFEELMRVLEDVRKQVEKLTVSSHGISAYLGKEIPRKKRKEVLADIMSKCAHVACGELSQERFGANLLGEDEGIALLSFSKEFGELEMEIIKIRIKMIALQNDVDIDRFETLDPPTRIPDTRLSPIGTAKNWEEVREMVRKLYETKCIRYSAAITPDKINKGQWVAKRLKEVMPSGVQDEVSRQIEISPGLEAELSGEIEVFPDAKSELSVQIEVPFELKGQPTERVSQMEIPANLMSLLSDIDKQIYPTDGKIHMFISELKSLDQSIQKQLVAIYSKKQ